MSQFTCTSSTMLGRVLWGIPPAQAVAEMDGEDASEITVGVQLIV